MKVAMLVLGHVIGDARVQKEAKTLAKAGHSVTVLGVQRAGAAPQTMADGFLIERVSLRTRAWGLGILARLLQYGEYAARTLIAAIELEADVYHAHDANTLPLAWLAARVTGGALVYDAHEFELGRNWGASNLPGQIRRMWTLQERLFIRRANLVITVSPSIAAELARIYGIPRPVVVLNAPEMRIPNKTNRLRSWLQIGEDAPIVLYQGAVTAGRGLHTLVEAAMKLPKVVVVILGDGPYFSDMQRWVRRQGWTDRVLMPGRVEWADLLDFTSAADIGVSLIENICLSYYYSLPNKLFEYLQAGVPVIASNFPEMRRIVIGHEVGIVVDPAAPADVVNALRLLLGQRALYERMQANTTAVAIQYSWSQQAEILLAAYGRLEQQ